MKHSYVYVSSWTHGTGEAGIGLFLLDNSSGRLSYQGKEITGVDFGFSWIDRERRLLYAIATTADLPGLRKGGGGRVFVFRIDPASGHLEQIGCSPTWGCSPAYLAVDHERKYLVAANHASRNTVTKIRQDAFGQYYPVVEYDDSTVLLFALNEDGSVGRLLDVVYHSGSGPEKRQTNAHPHSCELSPSGKLFAVCDKGNDTLRLYTIDREREKLQQLGSIVEHRPGTLPRYAVFHPTRPFLYHNNEESMELHAFRYTEEGGLQRIGAYNSLPECHREKEIPMRVYEQQGLVMHPSGLFLYDAVRGPETIAVFGIDQQSGELSKLQDVAVDGRWPRGITLTPDGRHLLLCNVHSHEICVYRVGEDGRLCATRHRGELDCAAFASVLSV